MIYLGITLLLLYSVLFFAYVFTTNDKPRIKNILGTTAILAAAPFFTGLGLFFSIYGDNRCYSEVISTLVKMPTQYEVFNHVNAIQQFTADTKKLPLEGYETNCTDLKSAVLNLVNKPKIELKN
jgi:hypothetical protein